MVGKNLEHMLNIRFGSTYKILNIILKYLFAE